MSKVERIKKMLKQDMIEYNKGIRTKFYTQQEIDAIDNLSDDYVLFIGRMQDIK